MFASEGDNISYATFTFNPSKFNSTDVAALKASRPFSRTARNFAHKYFSLNVKNAVRKISVVDTRNSTICLPLESEGFDSSCVENLVYRTATTVVKQVNLIQK